MIQQIAKIYLIPTILTVVVIFNQSVNGGTNGIAKQMIAATNVVSWSIDNASFEGITNADGLSCGLSVGNYCIVDINNKSTDWFPECWEGNFGANNLQYLKIELFDSQGKPVEKTEVGKSCGKIPSEQQLFEITQDSLRLWAQGRIRMSGFAFLFPMQNHQFGFSFNLTDLFELKQSGEYVLHIQMPFIQRAAWRNGEKKYSISWIPNGTHTPSTAAFSDQRFKIIWLPEVTAKVQIRREDISQTNLSSNIETNSPTK